MTTTAQLDAVSRLVRESVKRVDAIAPDALRALLPSLRAARDELRAELREWLDNAPGGGERFTAYQRAQALRALEGALARIEELQPAMLGSLGVGRRETGQISIENLDTEVQRLSAIFGGGIPLVPQLDTAALLAKGDQLLWKRHTASANRYAGAVGDDLRHQLALGVAKGETFEQLAQRMRKLGPGVRASTGWDPGEMSSTIADSMFHRWRHWADRLIRTENMHAYNAQHDLAITELNNDRDEDEDEWIRRWDASADKVTCERCKALDRTVAPIGGEFRWGYKAPPAHPYCRCTILAWLARWGGIKGEIPTKGDDGHDVAPAAPRKHEPKPDLPQDSKPERKPRKPRRARDIEGERHASASSAMAAGELPEARQLVDDAFTTRGYAAHATTNAQAPTVRTRNLISRSRARGMHWLTTGKIEIDTTVAEGAQTFAKEMNERTAEARAAITKYQRERAAFLKGKSTTLDELQEGAQLWKRGADYKTLVHESLHGFGGTAVHDYSGTGGKIEEITTEVTARRVMRERFGLDYTAVLKRGQVRGGGSYEDEIQASIRGIRKATGVSHARALRLLEDASDDYKRAAPDSTRFPHERIAESIARRVKPPTPEGNEPSRAGVRRDGSTMSRYEHLIERELWNAMNVRPTRARRRR